MRGVLSNMGRAFLVTFVAAAWPLFEGFLAAPSLADARALAVPVLVAAGASLLKAVQVFGPQITTGHAVADEFIRAGVAAFIVYWPGIYLAPDLGAAQGAGLALMTAVSAALLRTGVALVTKGETITGKPAPVTAGKGAGTGFRVPDQVAPPPPPPLA